MDVTPQLKLPILTPGDYANVPLYLQLLAEAVEAQCAAIDDVVTEALQRPAHIDFGSFGQTVAAAPDFVEVFLFGEYPADPTEFIGQPFDRGGIWHVLWSMRVAAVGAITAGSNRSGVVNLLHGSGVLWTREADFGAREMIETETDFGWTGLAGHGLCVVGDDYDRYRLTMAFQHENAASDVEVLSGTMAWRYVGSSDTIEVR